MAKDNQRARSDARGELRALQHDLNRFLANRRGVLEQAEFTLLSAASEGMASVIKKLS